VSNIIQNQQHEKSDFFLVVSRLSYSILQYDNNNLNMFLT